MRTPVFLLLASVAASAPAVTVEPLPPCEYADTEVSTNFSVVVDFDRMNRMDFTLSLVPSRSNSVEVAVGADRNGDGNLAPEEAAYVFGCDCCQWFVRAGGLKPEAGGMGWKSSVKRRQIPRNRFICLNRTET